MADSLATLAFLRGAGTFLQTYGLLEQGRAARLAGERARLAAQFQSWQAEEAGKLSIAVAQRQAAEEKRQADVLASRALAVAAASGGSVNDPTIVNLLTRTKGEGAYRAQVALYEGEAKARELRLQGLAGNVGGAQALVEGIRSQTGFKLASLGNLTRGIVSLRDKYGGNGPSGDSGLIDEVNV